MAATSTGLARMATMTVPSAVNPPDRIAALPAFMGANATMRAARAPSAVTMYAAGSAVSLAVSAFKVPPGVRIGKQPCRDGNGPPG